MSLSLAQEQAGKGFGPRAFSKAMVNTETSTGIHEVDKHLLSELNISFLMHYGTAFVVLRKAR